MENKMDNLEITTLNNNETAEMIVRGIEMKIEELFSNAENAKKSGNERAWATYLLAAATWADKLVQTEAQIRSQQIKL